MNTINNSWSTAPLGSAVLEMKGGASLSADDFTDFGFPVLHKGSIQPGGQLNFERDGKIHTSEAFVAANSSAVVDDRFVVATLRNLVRTGETLGFVAPVPAGRHFLLAQGAYGLRLDPERLDSRYLSHLSNAWVFHGEILRRMVGTTQVHIRNGDFLAVPVPFPPLIEQRRIAEILDRAEALRAKRRATLGQLDNLTQSIFLDMFGDPTTNPKGWPQVLIGDHASKIGSGSTPRGGEESYIAAGITLIRSMNVRDGAFLRDGLAFIDDAQAAQLEGVVVETGDVLLNITGASVARVCRAPADVLPARVNQHVAIIRPTGTFNSYFLEQCLLSPSMKERLLKIARAGATREAITKSAIEQFRVIRPPREVQDRFAARADAIKKTQLQMCSMLGELDSLFTSLQHRAFRGEL